MVALEVNTKNKLFRVDAMELCEKCSDYHKTIAELSIPVLVVKPKVFCRLVASLSNYLHTCSYLAGCVLAIF